MVEYQVCSRCVMDTTAKDIVFDDMGVCNYCRTFEKRLEDASAKVQDLQAHRDEFIAKVKADGKGKEYDCIIGVSGGVDSSYALYLAVKHGLRPLAVHLDNGWNSELASNNIANLITTLGVDLYTHVIDWEENRDLQCSFFKANVVDIELLMDNAMLALNYQQAAKYGLKYLLFGYNMATEGMRIPLGWNHFKLDVRNIKRIHKRYGTVPIKTHPLFSVMDWVKYNYLRGIKNIAFLDYFPYNKAKALELLQKDYEYKPYPYKHYESVFTRFYQGYILPRKFGYDKRRVHLSTLIVSGQMTWDEAMKLLEGSPYPDPKQEEQDRLFVIKKLGFTEENFNQYMNMAEVPHQDYGSEKFLLDALVKAYRLITFKNRQNHDGGPTQ
jgi:N-acetyl sugar amidotransferase